MKRYHEVAAVKDVNKIVGYLVNEGGPGSLTPYRYMNLEQFDRAVANNLIQYFQMEGGKAVVKYTQEELNSLPKKLHLTGKEYRQNDMYFRSSDIESVINYGAGIFKLVSIIKLPLMSVGAVGFIAYAPKQKIAELVNQIKSNPQYTLLLGGMKYGGNWVNMGIPLPLLKKDINLLEYIKRNYILDYQALNQSRTVGLNVECHDKNVIDSVIKLFGGR